MSEYVVELRNITKRFPGVVALKNMSIGILPGEIHGLIGENGAGKSTLIKVLTGVHKPEEGDIFVEGKKVAFHNPVQSREAGIACVYQELNIVKQLSVTDNIFMGRTIGKGVLLDYDRMHRQAAEALESLGHPEIDVRMEAGKLGVGQQQMVEIAKAISIDAKLIIMDEPTSSLGKDEIEQLMEAIKRLKSKGVAILFVSHKLDEIFEICDRCTVMRDGEHILTKDTSELTEDDLINAMVGRTLDNLYPKEFGAKGDVWLEVRSLNIAGVLRDVSFKAHAGQITGFAGLVGAGRTETMRAIFGADRLDGGEIYIKGEKVDFKSPKHAIKNRIAFLTEDRKGQGLILSEDVRTNLVLASMKEFSRGPFLNKMRIEETGRDNVTSLRIKTPSLSEVTAQLSGGNQQKVVIGKWVNTDADIFIFDEPTRGIDVGAKIEVYRIMNELVGAGKCVIMVSSELPEILAMSDRVVVMRGGKVMATIDRDSEHFNSESIMKAAWGGRLE
ncbi:MAG: sugar ABC transporter ATP-binding protein [Sphaerochaetaceae bacterium]|jgi:ribose transport system ATP-binding protein